MLLIASHERTSLNLFSRTPALFQIDWGDLEEEIDFGITVEEDDNVSIEFPKKFIWKKDIFQGDFLQTNYWLTSSLL